MCITILLTVIPTFNFIEIMFPFRLLYFVIDENVLTSLNTILQFLIRPE